MKRNGFRLMGSGLACGECRPLIVCGRGSAGSVGFTGSAGKVRRKKMKRRRVLIVLRAVVISSEVEKSFLHNGYRDLCPLSTFSNTSRFPSPNIRQFPACNRDPSTSVGMTTALNSIKILRRFHILMRRTIISHFSFLISYSSEAFIHN